MSISYPDVSRAEFRDAMARLGAAVHVITSDGPGGRAGFTASAVCSVTDTPPSLLVCLNRSASVYEAFVANQVMCVNTLAHSHEPLSALFGGKTEMEERFASGTWSRLVTGAPVLDDAVISFDCKVMQSVNVGTHDVLLGEVVGLRHGSSEAALFYFERRYHRLG
jgi:flavin reductase